jgi:hypothetical protein
MPLRGKVADGRRWEDGWQGWEEGTNSEIVEIVMIEGREKWGKEGLRVGRAEGRDTEGKEGWGEVGLRVQRAEGRKGCGKDGLRGGRAEGRKGWGEEGLRGGRAEGRKDWRGEGFVGRRLARGMFKKRTNFERQWELLWPNPSKMPRLKLELTQVAP